CRRLWRHGQPDRLRNSHGRNRALQSHHLGNHYVHDHVHHAFGVRHPSCQPYRVGIGRLATRAREVGPDAAEALCARAAAGDAQPLEGTSAVSESRRTSESAGLVLSVIYSAFFFSAIAPAFVYVTVMAFCILLASGPISMVITNESGLKSE